jgi:hypothetical protein
LTPNGFVLHPNSDPHRAAGKAAFSIEDFAHAGFEVEQASHIFAGLSDEPLPAAQLQIPATTRAKLALTIVDMDEK